MKVGAGLNGGRGEEGEGLNWEGKDFGGRVVVIGSSAELWGAEL